MTKKNRLHGELKESIERRKKNNNRAGMNDVVRYQVKNDLSKYVLCLTVNYREKAWYFFPSLSLSFSRFAKFISPGKEERIAMLERQRSLL